MSACMIKLLLQTSPHFLVQEDTLTGELREDKGTEINLLRTFSEYFNFSYVRLIFFFHKRI